MSNSFWDTIIFYWDRIKYATNGKGIRNIICRFDNHSCGVVFYNSYGLEPDMHCKNCGEELS